MIHRYFPAVGVDSTGPERKVHPDQPMDARFFASYASEDAVFSPSPAAVVCRVVSAGIGAVGTAEGSARRIGSRDDAGKLFGVEALTICASP